MPENENQVDYTECLDRISEDVAFLRESVTQDSEKAPVYEAQLQEVVTLLTEMKESGQGKNALDGEQLSALSVSVERIGEKVTDVSNVNAGILCGIGLMMGLVCACIFSRFVHS